MAVWGEADMSISSVRRADIHGRGRLAGRCAASLSALRSLDCWHDGTCNSESSGVTMLLRTCEVAAVPLPASHRATDSRLLHAFRRLG